MRIAAFVLLLSAVLFARATRAKLWPGADEFGSGTAMGSSPFSPAWHPRYTRPRGLRRPAARPQPAAQQEEPPTATESELVQIAFLHRHGARTEPEVEGMNLNWDRCHLSDTGAVMAVRLGQFLRGRYGAFLPERYSTAAVVSRSTDYERTIRTGYGVLHGIFGQSRFDVPFLSHKTQNDDLELSFYYSWPAALLHRPQILSYNADSAATTRSYFSAAELSALGRLVGDPTLCNDPASATTCSILAEDVATCRRSNGGLTPEFRGYLPQLLGAMARSNHFIYYFNDTDPYWQQTGPYALKLLRTVLGQFKAALDTPGPHPKAYHYSGHDVTIFGLLNALGAINATTTDPHLLVPMFTSTIVLELYANRSVRLVFARCDQNHTSNFTFRVDPTPVMRCRGAGGAYHSAECPLPDMTAEMEHKLEGSTAADPSCYADPVDVASTDCRPANRAMDAASAAAATAAGNPNPSYCTTYRAMCPVQACNESLVNDGRVPARRVGIDGDGRSAPTGFVFHPGDLSCRPVGVEHHVTSAEAAVLCGVGVAALLAGLLAGGAIRFLVARRCGAEDDDDLDDHSKGGVYRYHTLAP